MKKVKNHWPNLTNNKEDIKSDFFVYSFIAQMYQTTLKARIFKNSFTIFSPKERLSQGLCAFLLGLCMVHNDNSVLGATQEKLMQVNYLESIQVTVKLCERESRKSERLLL